MKELVNYALGRLYTAFFSRAWPVVLPLDPPEAGFLRIYADYGQADFVAARPVHVAGPGGLWRFEPGENRLAGLHPALAGVDVQGPLPEELHLALLESLLGSALERASVWLGAPLALTAAPGHGPKYDFSLPLRLEYSDGAMCPLRLHLCGDPLFFAARLERLPRGRRNLANLPFWVSIIAGSMRLPLGLLRKLEAEDVLLPQRYFGEKGLVLLRAGSLSRFCRAGEEMTVLEGADYKEFFMDDTQVKLDSIDSLEVVLHFELERRLIRLADLAALAPGVVLPLACDPLGPVTLTVNGRSLAKGILADMDGVLGVRVVRILDGVEAAP